MDEHEDDRIRDVAKEFNFTHLASFEGGEAWELSDQYVLTFYIRGTWTLEHQWTLPQHAHASAGFGAEELRTTLEVYCEKEDA